MAVRNPLRSRRLPPREWLGLKALRTLFRAQSRLMDIHKRHILETHGLKMSEFDMIAALGNTSGLRMGELAEKMLTSPANVTRVASALEKRGLVARRRSEHSDREVVAHLTPEGDAAFADAFMPVVNFSCDCMEGPLSPEELETLAALCEKLAKDPAPTSGQPRSE